MTKGYFAVFESVCKCGKTTIATKLTEALKTLNMPVLHKRGALSASKFSKKYNALNIKSLEYSSAFYWADAIFNTQNTISAMLRKEIVIQERYDLSIVSYREANGLIGDFLLLEEYLERGLLINPDLTVFLKAKPDVVFERIIYGEDTSAADLEFLDNSEKLLSMQNIILSYIKKLERNYISIETDKVSVDGAVRIIIEEILKTQ